NPSTHFLGDGETVASKLMGTRVHHFGAFFKDEWRAYDWTWGRLDGTAHLVRVLVTKEALTRVGAASPGERDRWAKLMADESNASAMAAALEELHGAPEDKEEECVEEIRDLLVKTRHRQVLAAEIPKIRSLQDEPSRLSLQRPRPGEGSAPSLKDEWEAICGALISTSVEKLAADGAGREIVGASLASALRALRQDEAAKRLSRPLKVAAFLVRQLTRRGPIGALSRMLVIVLTLVIGVLVFWTPFDGLLETAVRLACAALFGLLVAFAVYLVPGRLRHAFRVVTGGLRARGGAARSLLQRLRRRPT
ncbi:MAG TPA: DUF3376 domain-containing protein, partial [Gaiellaceae bacterium]|nr:DUF3376 domain-containing protein [Gaiellaceae bacterium]